MKRIYSLLLITMMGVVFFSGEMSAAAQGGNEIPVPSESLIPASERERLTDLVTANGEIRLLVELNLPQPFKPERRLSPLEKTQQRGRINQAQQEMQSRLGPHPGAVHRSFKTVPMMAVTVGADGLEELFESNQVIDLIEDEAVPPTLDGTVGIIGADTAVANGYDGTGQTVVILDTGIDGDHPFFADDSGTSRIVTEACFSTTSGSSITSLCPDGSDEQTGSGAAEVENNSACLDDSDDQLCTHGVHVAGIAAGNGTYAGVAYDGVAPNANIIPIQVFTRFESVANCGSSDPCVLSYSSDQLAALEYVYDTLSGTYDIASINMSLGSGQYTDYCDTNSLASIVENLADLGIATVIASGNNGYTSVIGAPACISAAVTVSATDNGDSVASYSNVSDLVDLFAPGSSVLSSYPGDTYASISGTSMATPHVAGAWALMKQRDPNASVDDVLSHFVDTGVSVTDSRSGGSSVIPRIQVDTALTRFDANVWDGSAGTDWHTAANWSQDSVPTSYQTVVISDTAAVYPIIDSDAVLGELIIHDDTAVTMTDGTLTVSIGWDENSSGQFTGSGGTLLLNERITEFGQNSNSSLNRLQIGDGAESTAVSLTSDIQVNGDLMISAAAELDAASYTITLGGDWDSTNGLFTAGTGIVHFAGDSQKVSADSAAASTAVELLSEDFSDYDSASGTCYLNGPSGWATEATASYGYVFCNVGLGGAATLWPATVSPDNGWLVTPGVDLSPGVTYTLSFDMADYDSGSSDPEYTVDVYLGTGQSSSDLTTSIGQGADVNTQASYSTVSLEFTVASADTYYLGLNGEQDGYYGFIDNVALTGLQSTSYTFEPYNLEVSSTAGLTSDWPLAVSNDLTIHEAGLFDISGQTVTVDGVVTNNGALRETLSVNGATEFLNILDSGGTSSVYRGIDVIQAGNMGETTLTVYGNQYCANDNGESSVLRCVDIDPTTAQTASLRFYYDNAEANGNSESGMQVYDWNGSSWDVEGGNYTRSSGADPAYVEVTGVSDYTLFTLSDATPSTAYLDASAPAVTTSFDGATLSFVWEDSFATCAFNVYHSDSPFTGFTLYAGDVSGSELAVTQASIVETNAYFYVEAVGCNGTSTADSATAGLTHFALTAGD